MSAFRSLVGGPIGVNINLEISFPMIVDLCSYGVLEQF